MNRLLLFCLVAFSCLIDVAVSNDALYEPVSKHGYLSVNGVNLVDKNGDKVQLKGMSLAWSIWFSEFYTTEAVDAIKNLCHSNIVRAALSVGTDNGGYLQDPDGQLRLVETVIDAAIKDDIYVLVDWHEVDSNIHLAEAKQFFTHISQKYGNYPNIIYETYNEPISQSWSGQLKPYHEEIIKTIRANDPNNVIILGTPNYSQKVDEAAADPITGQKNIMYTLHFYAGTHKQWLRDTAQAALNKGLPIFVTEYGTVNADASGPVDLPESRLWWAWLDQNNMSYVDYAVCAKDEAASVMKPGSTSAQTCQDAYMTESGKLAVEKNKS